MTNQNSTYLVLVSVSQMTSSGLVNYQFKNSLPYADNSACIQGESSFSARANAQISTSALNPNNQTEPADALSCGLVDINNDGGPGNGLFSLVIGFMLMFAVLNVFGKRYVFFV